MSSSSELDVRLGVIVRSEHFALFTSVLVVLNAIEIGVQTDYMVGYFGF